MLQSSTLLRRLTVAGKLKLIIMCVTGASLLAASIATAGYDIWTLRSLMVRNLSILAELMGSNSTASLSFQDADVAAEVLRSLRAHPHITRAATFTPEARSLRSTSETKMLSSRRRLPSLRLAVRGQPPAPLPRHPARRRNSGQGVHRVGPGRDLGPDVDLHGYGQRDHGRRPGVGADAFLAAAGSHYRSAARPVEDGQHGIAPRRTTRCGPHGRTARTSSAC